MLYNIIIYAVLRLKNMIDKENYVHSLILLVCIIWKGAGGLTIRQCIAQ